MATSSRPFQSQTVARLVASYRQMARGAGHWLRQGRTAAVWGLQVAVYPLYVAVQGLRMGYRQLRAAHPWRPLWAKISGQHLPELVEADTPIRALLSVIQPPVVQPPVGATLARQPGGPNLVNRYGQWLRQSRAGAVLTPGQWHLIPFQASIRGIASDLVTRQVVLVTVDNDIFAELTHDQQQRLQQAMVLMLAEYGRLRHRHALDHMLQQPWLPLPESRPTALPPLRWLPLALRWLQNSPLAAATSLFGEARQQTQAISERTVVPSQVSSPKGPRLYIMQIARHPTMTTVPVEGFDFSPRLHRGTPIYGPPQFDSTPSLQQLHASPSETESLTLTVAASRAVVEHLSCPLGIDGTQGTQASLRAASTGNVAISADPLPPLDAYPTDQRQLAPASAIEAQVTQVDYIDAPLVAVLRGLDWVLYAIETWLRGFWAWLQKQW
ncbi:hypothetical protein C7293_16000 [filamentous cyanobacterium CCT1]|nr:hypothetical protein C7293_16000 [filamentous cyanobacterium CCT1]PSN77843.1 hypothetical protein C8B47_19940 [filamentous cyanobacterium CCP4]